MKRGFLKNIAFTLITLLLSCNPFDPVDPAKVDPINQPDNDSYEPNNSITQASFIKSDSVANLICIPGDFDYYKFVIDSNSLNTIKIKTLNKSLSMSSISFYLYSKTGVSLKNSSLLSDSVRTVSFFSGIQDTIYCYVYNSSSYTKELKYSLTKKSQKISIIDSTEPNNSIQTATLVANTNRSAFTQNANDTDWYKIPLLANEYLTVSVASDSINITQVTPLLTRSNGLTVSGSKVGYTTTYTYYSSSADTCYLKIYAYLPKLQSSPSRYSIIINKTATTDDKFEENDTKLTARLITKGKTDSLKSIGSDVDYYKFASDTTMYVEAVIKTPSIMTPSSYLYLYLESVNSTLKSAYNYSSDSVKITYTVSAKDSVYLKVFNPYPASTSLSVIPYSIELRATPISDDKFEENDTKLTAKTITSGKYDTLKAFMNDYDYYKVSFDTPVILDAVVKKSGVLGSSSYMYLYLETISSTLTSASTSTGDSLKLSYPIAAGDTVYIRVYYSSSSSTASLSLPYSLQIKATPISEIDPKEPNETRLSSIVIDSTTNSLIYSSSDIDWFKIPHSKDELLEVQVKTDSLKSQRVTSYMYNYSVSPISGAALSNYTTSYTYSSSQNDTCYLNINYYTGTSSTPYQIIINRTKIVEDKYEENDTKLTAKEIKIGAIHDSLMAIGSDVDYYKFSVDTTSAINFVLRPKIKMTSSSYLSFNLESISSTLKSFSSYSYDSLQITYIVNPKDTLYLKVMSSSSQSAIPYTLDLKATPIADDSYEDNDTLSTAVKIPFGQYDLKYVDQDWFSVDVDSGATIRLDAELSSSTSSTVSMYLYYMPSTSLSTINYVSLALNSTTGFSYISAKKQTLYIAFRSTNFTGTSELNYRFRVVQL